MSGMQNCFNFTGKTRLYYNLSFILVFLILYVSLRGNFMAGTILYYYIAVICGF